MAEKRQLDETERKLVEKNISFLTDELEYSKALVKQSQLTVDLAPVFYKKQLAEVNHRLTQNKESVKEIEGAIAELNRQLTEGVEVKEKKETDNQ